MTDRGQLIKRIQKIDRRLQKTGIRHAAFEHLPQDITVQQLRTLGLLAFGGPQASQRLADELGIGPTSMTGIVDRLQAKGYVEREPDPTDRRVRRVTLTEHGTALLRGLEEIKSEAFDRAVELMSTDDIERLASGLEALAIAMENAADTNPSPSSS